MAIAPHSARSPHIHRWIIFSMLCVVAMVMIGGATRLTESGLSIVEWKLFSGIFPPLTDAQWQESLAEYRLSPEYQKINRGMEVSEFQRIYWLEYIHRLMGRITGLMITIPFFWFLLRRKMDGALSRRMLACCILVALQGVVGWVMVKSGLVDDPRVSPVRLALHLSLAFTLFCTLYLTRLQLRGTQPFKRHKAHAPIRIVTALLALQIILGALVAGLDAGLSYNTFPLMDGAMVPDQLLMLEPWHRNLLENNRMVQFQHRALAVLVSLAVFSFIIYRWRARPSQNEKQELILFGILLLLQFALGVLTLIHVVPIVLAMAHQLVALALLAHAIKLCYLYNNS